MTTDENNSFTPPPDAESVTKDGGVKKVVLSASDGDLPTRHARCLVHYVGRLADSGEEFFNTKTETESGEAREVIAGRASSLHEKGLNLGVATMKVGEKARLFVSPQYGYGEKGHFSFPTVPPNADLVYDVELLACGEVEEKPASSMLFEERLEAAERRRLDGNAHFIAGKYEEAQASYLMAMSYINEEFMYQLEGVFLDSANAVRLPVLLNMAAVKMKQEAYLDAAACCTEVLNHDPNNVKALFRRGKCRRLLGQTAEAEADLMKAASFNPDDKAIANELQQVSRSKKAEAQAEKKLFAGKFNAGGLGLYEGEGEGLKSDGNGAQSGGAQRKAAPPSTSFLFRIFAAAWEWVLSLFYGKLRNKAE